MKTEYYMLGQKKWIALAPSTEDIRHKESFKKFMSEFKKLPNAYPRSITGQWVVPAEFEDDVRYLMSTYLIERNPNQTELFPDKHQR